MTSGLPDEARHQTPDAGTPDAERRSLLHEAVESRSGSRVTVACGLLFALLGMFVFVTLRRTNPAGAWICGVLSLVHLGAVLEVRRTGRYTTPAAVIGLNAFLAIVSSTLIPSGPEAALGSITILFLALMPQLAMYLLGARSGIAMALATVAYLSVAFGWLMLHPERATEPIRSLTLKYVFGVVVIVISFVLSFLYLRARTRMVAELKTAHDMVDTLRLREQRRLEEELNLAARDLGVEGLEIAASMLPATEVGGDYYDVLPFEHGAWLCIGDVAGHGLNAGLVMLMMQSVVSAFAKDDPLRTPDRVLCALNATLLRYQRDGRVLFAGAHEELLVFRAAEGRCEAIPTPGPWMGAVRDVTQATSTSRLTLGDGDVLVLYSDGLTEARNGRQPFGLERVEAELLRTAGEPVETIRAAILGAVRAWSAVLDDDVTLVVARYRAPGRGALSGVPQGGSAPA